MNDWLLQVEFDKIMFTGSPRVGREIMTAAAQNLTSVTLELGGKSPVFIAADADIRRAAQRIAWGKCLNSGQTCVGPDYALVHEDAADEFVEELQRWIHEYYGEDVLASPDYPHMINQKHFDMVCRLIDDRPQGTRIAFGGRRNPETLQIEPTVVTGVSIDDPLMSQEIFGPALPSSPGAMWTRRWTLCGRSSIRWPAISSRRAARSNGTSWTRCAAAGPPSTTWSFTRAVTPWASAACRTPVSAPITARWASTRSLTTSPP